MKALVRFFRTPKGLLLILLVILAAAAAVFEGAMLVMPGLLSAVVVAAAIDAPILRLRGGRWEFPSGAVLTGLFVAMVLSPHERWPVVAATAAIAIVSKYLARTRSANIFNPAALALVVSFYLFSTGQSWWGALGDAPTAALVLLFATGLFITDRVNKMPLVITFLGVYYLLFTLTAYLGDARRVAEVFVAPDVNAALFFAFFILTDPPTSPVKYRDQMICAVIVAVASYGIFAFIGAVHYLLSGVLVGNVWEAWRRWRAAGRRTAERLSRLQVEKSIQPSGH